jgi:uncharacterized membrane protein YhaH (DUF805 family)
MRISQIYLSFKGRLSLKKYWLYWMIPLIMLELLLMAFKLEGPQFTWIWRVTNTLIIWPAIATTVKRLHDMNKSGWWTLVHLVPFLGSIILTFILSFIPGSKGQNQFG